ncbi:acyl-CoA dehydrogenase family protein [Sedimenticola sp.]|uniref:acyl-CoA dehydrogenase family protein n=1 Tax=Sedimenticola sp. TaxID=1940285 RepID=UPI003D0E86F7
MADKGLKRYPPSVRGMNFFNGDKNLLRFLERRVPHTLKRQKAVLKALGRFAGGELDEQAQESDAHYPATLNNELVDPIRPDERCGKVVINRRYEDCQQELYHQGTIYECFKSRNRESHILPFVTQYLVSQSDISTGCPYAMTHPVAYVIHRYAAKDVKNKFLKEIIRTDGQAKVGGTWATEKHSGSDIGASETRAITAEDGTIRLYGLKWFTSAIGFKSFLTIATARPDGAVEGGKGLGLYLVPSHIDDDWEIPNHYNVRYLKDKLGTKGLPTGETELQGTLARELVLPPNGLRVMMEALGCSRVHNAMAAAGVMRRSLNETLCWTSNRETFDKKLIERPMVQKRILEIATESMAGFALASEAAHSFDQATQDDNVKTWMRMVTALAKFKTAEQAVWCAEKALALGGGNAYTKDFPIERILRDAHVLPVWEGPEQIQALELMRMVAGREDGAAVFIAKLRDIEHALPAVMKADAQRLSRQIMNCKGRLSTLKKQPQKMELVADDFLHQMADTLAYGLLCAEAVWELESYNDRTKLLYARHYYGRTLAHERPFFNMTELHENFTNVVNGIPVSS